VIAFGCSIAEPEPYHDYAEPGIQLAAEPDSQLYAFAATGPIARTCNLILDAAATRDDLEALVLIDVHAEIADRDFCAKVREALHDPNVAIAGCAGARDVRGIAWWEGTVSCGPVIQRYGEHGGGEVPAYAWANPEPAPAEVLIVDGFLLVLSPWAVRNLRFDEAIRNHGYDVDFCLQAREAGRRARTAPFEVVYHRSVELIGDIELWVESHIQIAEKWGVRLTGEPADEDGWRARARRAEAEREAARAIAYSNGLIWDARILELERALDAMTSTAAWRITAPLRHGNRLRRQLVERLRR
jgi:hypothetical protein